jgi:tetratricopeptide (TPR) repeat protein
MVLAAPGPLLTPPPSSSPPKTPHRSYSAITIANTYQAQGKYEEALEMDTKSLNIKTRILGGDHPLAAQTRENMADIYADQGK